MSARSGESTCGDSLLTWQPDLARLPLLPHLVVPDSLLSRVATCASPASASAASSSIRSVPCGKSCSSDEDFEKSVEPEIECIAKIEVRDFVKKMAMTMSVERERERERVKRTGSAHYGRDCHVSCQITKALRLRAPRLDMLRS